MGDSVMMAWKDQLLDEASYNGVPFYIESCVFANKKNTDTQAGHRKSRSSNVSIKRDEFSISAVIFGPNYLATKADLIKQLSSKGQGKLCHPYYGKDINVIPGDYSVKEFSTKGGCAQFDIVFLPCEKIKLDFKKNVISPGEKKDESLLDKISKAIEDSNKILKKIEIWKSNIKEAIDKVDTVNKVLNDFADSVYSSMTFVGDLKAQLNGKALQALKLRARLNDIRQAGPETWNILKSIIKAVTGIETKGFYKQLFASFKNNYQNIEHTSSGDTDTKEDKEKEESNKAMSHILSLSVIGNYAEAFSETMKNDPDNISNKEAEASKNDLIKAIDKLIEDSESLGELSPITTDIYLDLLDLKVSVQKETATFISQNKNRIIKAEEPQSLVILLHENNIDISDIDSIIKKNNILNPFLIQGEIEC